MAIVEKGAEDNTMITSLQTGFMNEITTTIGSIKLNIESDLEKNGERGE
jgi:hypothetical protein